VQLQHIGTNTKFTMRIVHGKLDEIQVRGALVEQATEHLGLMLTAAVVEPAPDERLVPQVAAVHVHHAATEEWAMSVMGLGPPC
jgi:hypothetical protein